MRPSRAKPHATIQVNNDGDGPIIPSNCNELNTCRLRDAIAVAADGDTIKFDGNYTIRLTSELVIPTTKNLAIDGTGHTVTLDGQNSVRVLKMNSVFGMTLNALTITHGTATVGDGGGIYIDHTLFVVVSNCTISSNSGGGIYNNGGTLNVTNSSISSNSGSRLYNDGDTLNVTNSSISSNSGYGLYNAGTLNVTNSTFSSNSANAINLPSGGGIYNTDTGTLNVTNSTFSSNSASAIGGYSGGGILNTGTLTVTNSTFSGNFASGLEFGGGILNTGAGATTLKNTIMVNNTGGGNCGCAFTDGGGNLEDGTTCGFNAANGSFPNTNPQLGALTGSPAYFPLNANSPAIDAGNATTCAAAVGSPNYGAGGLDQRGQPRNDLQCDSGAYEMQMSDRN